MHAFEILLSYDTFISSVHSWKVTLIFAIIFMSQLFVHLFSVGRFVLIFLVSLNISTRFY